MVLASPLQFHLVLLLYSCSIFLVLISLWTLIFLVLPYFCLLQLFNFCHRSTIYSFHLWGISLLLLPVSRLLVLYTSCWQAGLVVLLLLPFFYAFDTPFLMRLILSISAAHISLSHFSFASLQVSNFFLQCPIIMRHPYLGTVHCFFFTMLRISLVSHSFFFLRDDLICWFY